MAYLPGSFFLTTVPGWGGYLISLGQALAGDPSRWDHAGIVLDADGTVLEAEPGGARIANLSEYAGQPLLLSDAPVQQAMGNYGLDGCAGCQFGVHPHSGPCACGCKSTQDVRATVVAEAHKLIGVPYSALDYIALAALHLHLPSGWVRRRVETSGHMICSQMCDAVFLRAGIHLFSDGRLPGDVMPADLAAYAEDWAAGNA